MTTFVDLRDGRGATGGGVPRAYIPRACGRGAYADTVAFCPDRPPVGSRAIGEFSSKTACLPSKPSEEWRGGASGGGASSEKHSSFTVAPVAGAPFAFASLEEAGRRSPETGPVPPAPEGALLKGLCCWWLPVRE